MPEIPKTEYVPPQAQPATTAVSYCELATYDAALLAVSSPAASAELRRLSAKCDEDLARRVLAAVTADPAVRRDQARLTEYWEAQRPSASDLRATASWLTREPQLALSPDRWAATTPGDREKFKARARAWLATNPTAPPPETLWERAVRYAREHPTSIAAVGVGLVVATLAVVIGARRRSRELPSAERELEERGYDRYDHLRDEEGEDQE